MAAGILVTGENNTLEKPQTVQYMNGEKKKK